MSKKKSVTGPFVALSKTQWTRFMDMHSGGSRKEKWEYIYIQAPEEEAKVIFYNRFGHNPERVTCTCCGRDYSTSSDPDLAQLTAYDRHCAYDPKTRKYVEKPRRLRIPKLTLDTLISLENYMKEPSLLFIFDKDIQDWERAGDVPEQGYVWQ